MTAPTLEIARRSGRYWIVGLPGPPLPADPDYPQITGTEIGPYRTKAEAEDDRRGVRRFYRDLAGTEANAA